MLDWVARPFRGRCSRSTWLFVVGQSVMALLMVLNMLDGLGLTRVLAFWLLLTAFSVVIFTLNWPKLNESVAVSRSRKLPLLLFSLPVLALLLALLAFAPRFPELTSDGPRVHALILSLAGALLVSLFTIRRLNDREQPRWIGWSFTAIVVALVLATQFFQFLPVFRLNGFELSLFFLPGVLVVWVVIDCMFFAGAPWPNRHGAVPPKFIFYRPEEYCPVPGPTPEPGRGRSSVGIMRNAFVAFVAASILVQGVVNIHSTGSGFHEIAYLFMAPRHVRDATPRETYKRAHKFIRRSILARRNGYFEAALKFATRAYEIAGGGRSGASALVSRARVYLEMKRIDDAIADLKLAMEANPRSPFPHQYYAETLQNQGDIHGALAAYDEAAWHLSLYHKERGYLLQELHRTNEAIAAYGAVIRSMKPSLSARYIGKIIGIGEIRHLNEYERQDLAKVLIARGDLYRDRGDAKHAFEDYNDAVAARPDYAQAYDQRGWMHELLGDLDLARVDYERAYEIDPVDEWLTEALAEFATPKRRSKTRVWWARYLRNSGHYDEALVVYEDAIRLGPGSPWPFTGRAWLHIEAENFELAIADANAALERNEFATGAHALRGIANLELRNLSQALEDLDFAVERQPGSAFNLLHRGRVHEALGDIARARADYKAALKFEPHSQQVQGFVDGLSS